MASPGFCCLVYGKHFSSPILYSAHLQSDKHKKLKALAFFTNFVTDDGVSEAVPASSLSKKTMYLHRKIQAAECTESGFPQQRPSALTTSLAPQWLRR
ncbi:hypothetical protein MRX96_006201 [Rhipicephalus microplus]